jgi:hypothetical protein
MHQLSDESNINLICIIIGKLNENASWRSKIKRKSVLDKEPVSVHGWQILTGKKITYTTNAKVSQSTVKSKSR